MRERESVWVRKGESSSEILYIHRESKRKDKREGER